MQPKKLYAAVAAALATCPLAHAAVEEMPSTLKDQQSVAITIYNENLALVKDTRRVTLEAGPNRLALREVSGRMRPETASLRSLTQPRALTLIEQNKAVRRSEEHTSELQSRFDLVCRLLLEKKNKT